MLTSRTTGNEAIEPGNVVPLNSPVYHFDIFETGSWDPALGAFISRQGLQALPQTAILLDPAAVSNPLVDW
ncbi:hypothetical protein C8Q76DRAFT_800329 [Earliella scabrosa]|nr:hypothetical protein C8Q76DRAFT_800329 [Earliella scabrosa]